MSEVPARPRSQRMVAVLVGLAAVAVLAWAFSIRLQRQELAAAEQDMNVTLLGVKAPAVDLYDRSEKATNLSSYRGRLVVVNYWATWCGPCRAEMDSLIALSKSVDPGDVAFVAIAEDDTWPPVDEYLAAKPLPFDVYRDRPPRVENQFEVSAYPTTFLIGRDGQALYRFDGARDWDTPQARRLLELQGARLAGR